MEKPKKIVRLSKDSVEPLVCKDRDDFTKFFFSLAAMFAENNSAISDENDKDNMGFVIESMQLLMHEYMSLVFKGEMEPYNIKFGSDADKDESIKAFRQGMIEVTERLMKSGVPMEENDGKFGIMFDELKKKGAEEFGNG